MLDESNARVLMLIAPAGYGKTTLAREWLEGKRHVWYQGGAASADVAALAVGLANACRAIVPQAGKRMSARLRASNSPEEDVEPLAELLAEDLSAWPDDAWLAIDDYHCLSDSAASEQFVDILLQSDVRLLLASRHRPTWANARRLIYGELHEVGRDILAMTEQEATELLSTRVGTEADEIIAVADGWPAVIGLAALAVGSPGFAERLPTPLHEFFADELYQAVSPSTRVALCQLAVAPSITSELARSLFGPRTRMLVDEAVEFGLLTRINGGLDLHPLLRNFLLRRGQEHGPSIEKALRKAVLHYLATQSWDDLFALAEAFDRPDVASRLLREALMPTLKQGRVATVVRWVTFARDRHIEDPVVDLAQAELQFRRGENAQSEVLALHAAVAMESSDPLASRAYFIGGEAAHLNHRDEEALVHFARARKLATRQEDSWRALWGQFLSAASLQHPECPAILAEFEQLSCNAPDFLLCRATAPAVLGLRWGSLSGALGCFTSALPLVRKAADPLVKSAFLALYGMTLALEARYATARDVMSSLVNEARATRLDFVLGHASTTQAYAELGLRRFRQAISLLSNTRTMDDPHLRIVATGLLGRVYLAQGLVEKALEVLNLDHDAHPEPAFAGEFIATKALAIACSSSYEQAISAADEARQMTSGVEAAVLAACAEAIAALRAGDAHRDDAVEKAYELSRSTHNLDGLVCSYRAYPPLLAELGRRGANPRRFLSKLIANAHDYGLAQRAGLKIARQETGDLSGLTNREREVLALVAEGLTNKEIAKHLYISESTAKLHVFRVRQKLGARSRTEAALLATKQAVV
jgi:ATP/maltotriose-dependent transcriptional regulator MalT